MPEEETVIDSHEQNGDMPPDHVAASVTFLIEQSRDLREKRDELRARREAIAVELKAVADELGRYDRAVKALTGVPQKAARAQTEQKKVKAARTARGGDPSINNAREGYPAVSEHKQTEVYNALKAIGHPIGIGDLVRESGLNRSMTSNALAHLRARGLVRWAGTGRGGGHNYAIFNEGDEDVTD